MRFIMSTSAVMALRMWGPRQWYTALFATAASIVVLGVPTVLIPNSLFVREIPPTVWSYPVWIVTSILMGLLVATYVRPAGVSKTDFADQTTMADAAGSSKERSSTVGVVGGALAWFAIGCPVCNKIVLIALGASGAMTWFAPVQPYLAALALVLSGIALLIRLKGQVACPTPPREKATESNGRADEMAR